MRISHVYAMKLNQESVALSITGRVEQLYSKHGHLMAMPIGQVHTEHHRLNFV